MKSRPHRFNGSSTPRGRRRETGSIKPRLSTTGPPPRIGATLEPFIHDHFRTRLGTTLPKLAAALEVHAGQRFGLTTVWRASRRLDGARVVEHVPHAEPQSIQQSVHGVAIEPGELSDLRGGQISRDVMDELARGRFGNP